MPRLSTPDTVPVGPTLSMFDPIYLGVDEAGEPVYLPLMYNNLLIGGVPGSGKSVALSLIVSHAALSADCRLCLIDGKQVELGLWQHAADVFVGPDIDTAITTLRRLQTVMDNRYAYLMSQQRRKIERGDQMNTLLLAIDEIAYFSATVGAKTQRETFSMLLRDIVARGRAVAVIVVGAAQRPTADIVPTSLRDIFSWRLAGRCTTDISSDVILGYGWAARGYSAATIHPLDQGVVWLIAEDGHPRRIKTAYLTDDQIVALAAYARDIRRHPRSGIDTEAPAHQVVWNLHAGELWRRSRIALDRAIRRITTEHGIDPDRIRVSYGKVAEMQRRGVVHFHAIIRLDGIDPDNPDTVAPVPDGITLVDLTHAIEHAVGRTGFITPPHHVHPEGWLIAWGDQLDIRPVRIADDQAVTDQMVAGYLAKYATKSTEASGHVSRRLTRETIDLYADPQGNHTERLIHACWHLGGYVPGLRLSEQPERPYARLRRWAHMLGFGGHFLTKSRRYSTTFRVLRENRVIWRRHENADDEHH